MGGCSADDGTIASQRIFSLEDGSWVKSPQEPGPRGTIVFNQDEAPWELWQIDFSEGWQKVTIRNTGSRKYALADGDGVITMSRCATPRQSLHWEIQPYGIAWTIKVPGKHLYWNVVEGGQVALSFLPQGFIIGFTDVNNEKPWV